MNKVVNLIAKNEKREVRSLYRESEDIDLLPVLYMYGDSIEGLCGTQTIVDGLEFASIETLRNEIEEQRQAIRIGYDKYNNVIDFDDIVPWELDGHIERLIVCKEGVFEWSWEKETYQFIGKLQRTDRRKKVTILEDSKLFIHGETVYLERGDSFFLDGEYVAYDDKTNPIVMLVVEDDTLPPLAIPYDSNIMFINNIDLAVVVSSVSKIY